jgi:hypothetical protein
MIAYGRLLMTAELVSKWQHRKRDHSVLGDLVGSWRSVAFDELALLQDSGTTGFFLF